MIFPANIVLLGASAVAGIALIVAGHLLVTTAREMGNPDLDQTARTFMGCWALAVAVTLLSFGAGVTMIAHANNLHAPTEAIAEGNDNNVVLPRKRDP